MKIIVCPRCDNAFDYEEEISSEEKARADERERCIQAIEYAHDDDYTDWKEIALEAIKAE